MDYLAEKQITLEICPMSNIFTKKYVSSYEDHPIKLFFDRNIFVTVNTDDPTIFGAELIDEYVNLIEHGIFNLDQSLHIMQNTLEASFLPQKEKDRISKLAAAQVPAK